jgi:hypothetical protein
MRTRAEVYFEHAGMEKAEARYPISPTNSTNCLHPAIERL